MAAKMNQRGFTMDARKIAFIPANTDFFPRLKDADSGIVYTASETFHTMVENVLANLVKRPDLIIRLGPDDPNPRTKVKREEP